MTFVASHVVNEYGAPAWTDADAASGSAPPLDPGLPLQLLESWGEWARVRCDGSVCEWKRADDEFEGANVMQWCMRRAEGAPRKPDRQRVGAGSTPTPTTQRTSRRTRHSPPSGTPT